VNLDPGRQALKSGRRGSGLLDVMACAAGSGLVGPSVHCSPSVLLLGTIRGLLSEPPGLRKLFTDHSLGVGGSFR